MPEKWGARSVGRPVKWQVHIWILHVLDSVADEWRPRELQTPRLFCVFYFIIAGHLRSIHIHSAPGDVHHACCPGVEKMAKHCPVTKSASTSFLPGLLGWVCRGLLTSASTNCISTQ